MKRLAVARLWHEGNSFSPLPTGLPEFRRREWFRGQEALARYRGTATELGAVIDFAEAQQASWSVEVLRCASAPPGGPVEDALWEEIADELARDLRAGEWDAVYLSLHGALVTPRRPQADLDLVRRVRAAIGATPLGASFDLHGNLSPELADLLDFASAYKTHPHVDMRETASRVLDAVRRIADGEPRPRGAIVKVPALLHSLHMRTSAGPMAETVALARDLTRPPVRDISVFGGFVWSDTPDAGGTAMAYAETREPAERAAQAVADALWARRDRFRVSLPGAAEGLATALRTPGLVAVLDPADNPLSGGIGDTPALLRTLLEAGLAEESVFAFLLDPRLVERAHDAGPGAWLSCRLGGRLTPEFGPPVEADAEVVALTEGKFVNEGPFERGLPVELGPTAVLRVGAVRIIVTSSCQAGIDPAYFRLHGVDLTAIRLVVAKAKNHFRAAFEPIAAAIVEIDAPGPAALDLAALPFRHVPAGIEL
jgi:microcystin degradation protein MlrC